MNKKLHLKIIPLPYLRGRGWGWGFVWSVAAMGLCVTLLLLCFLLRHDKPKQQIGECSAECCADSEQHVSHTNECRVKFKIIGKSATNATENTVGRRTLKFSIHSRIVFLLLSTYLTLRRTEKLQELALFVGMDAVVYTQRSREHLDESLSLLGCPSVLHLAVFSEFRLEQIVLAVYTYGFKS